jgi:tRNA-dihydrouridine synthase 2
MVRASTTPLRALALQYGADFVYTEELVDRSLSATVRHVNEEMKTVDYLRDTSNLSAKVQRRAARDKAGVAAMMLRIDPSLEKGKLVCQLGTGEPNLALHAALHVHMDVDAIDVNMGCPKKFSVSGGMGSALLNDPDRASRIIRCLRNGIPTKPISAKIRLLKDTAATLDFCQALVNGGVNAIATHGRRVGDDSTQPAHWDELKETVSLLRSKHARLPILVNGDFYTRTEWTEFMEETGANGVLLARPALYNTSIFRKPTESTSPPYGYESPLLLDKTSVVQDYLRYVVKYNTHVNNCKYVVCEMMTNRRAPIPRAQCLKQEFLGRQTIGKMCSCRSLDDVCNLWNVDSTRSESVALASEHRYEDSYFLHDSHRNVENQKTHLSDETYALNGPKTKRVRAEETM